MDPSSVITQVYRGDPGGGGSDEDSSLNSHSVNSEKVAAPPTKPKSPSLFKKFFCCFRPPRSSERNGSMGVGGGSPGVHVNKNNNCGGPQPLSQQDDAAVTHAFNVPGADSRIQDALLSAPRVKDRNKKCVVIDLDETLVHSSFAPVNNPDFIIPVEIDGTIHQVYVLKRPHVDEFLQKMGEMFECVLFTASLGKYADPVTDLLDKWGVFRARLFRESCVFHRGNYVKDLSRLGRDLRQVVILDNSPASYLFHPDNAVPILTWFDDPSDHELVDLLPFFERLAIEDDVYTALGGGNPAVGTLGGVGGTLGGAGGTRAPIVGIQGSDGVTTIRVGGDEGLQGVA